MLDTLLVVWWYTDTTAALARTSAAQLRLSAGVERIRHKPFVVAVRRQLESGGYDYCISNIGSGLALAVWYVSETGDEPSRRLLGALGAGNSRPFPEGILRPLCDQDDVAPFALVAEGLVTRTAQWTVTANARGRGRGSDVFNQPIPVLIEEARPIDQLLAAEWPAMRTALRSTRTDGQPNAA